MDKLGYFLPIGMVILLFFLKMFINESFSFETFKRVFVEVPIDIATLGISITVTYIIAIGNKIHLIEKSNSYGTKSFTFLYKPQDTILDQYWEWFGNAWFRLFIFIILLVIVVFISKWSISKYQKDEKIRYIVIGSLVGYVLSIPTVVIPIVLLEKLGG